MSLISVSREKQVHFTSSSARATGTDVGVLYFNIATNPTSFSGIQKQSNTRVSFEYSGWYEIGFFVRVGTSTNTTTFIQLGINGSFLNLDEVSQGLTNFFFCNYSFIFQANANDFLELRALSQSGIGLFTANMQYENRDASLSNTMTIKKL
jgi:hypothetical protein